MLPKLEQEYDETQIFFKDINEFKNKFSINLPESYEKFLLEYNGYRVNYNYIYNLNNNHEPYLHTIIFFSLNQIIETSNLCIEDQEDESSQFYKYNDKSMLPIADANLNLTICICYSNENFGKIYYTDEVHDDEFIFIANSFEDFIKDFEINPD